MTLTQVTEFRNSNLMMNTSLAHFNIPFKIWCDLEGCELVEKYKKEGITIIPEIQHCIKKYGKYKQVNQCALFIRIEGREEANDE